MDEDETKNVKYYSTILDAVSKMTNSFRLGYRYLYTAETVPPRHVYPINLDVLVKTASQT